MRVSELDVKTTSVDETVALGARLGALLEAHDFIALEGPLGAGKTRLAEGLARGLGVDPALRIPSPTFTLVNEHAGRVTMLHADFYRLGGYAELEALGWRDYLEREAVIVVEWLSRVGAVNAPADRVEVHIEPTEGDGRRLRISATGPRSAARLAALT